MKTFKYMAAVLAVSSVAGCASIKSICTEDEENIPLSSIPKAVMDTASSAVKGFEAEEASVEKEHGQMVYELKGKADGDECELNIAADGKMLQLEREKD